MRLWNFGAWVLALLVVSCGGETGMVAQQPEGTVQLPLVSPAPDGKVYRLVGATFNIVGPQTVTIEDTSADTVQTTLLAGAYTVELGGSWHMERVDAPGTIVPAQLLSPNPLPFFVTKEQVSQVRFLFKLPGDGSADVGIHVDSGGWLAGTIRFNGLEYPDAGPTIFDELVGKSVPFLISFESIMTSRESWSKQVYVQTSPTTVQFGGPPSALLERVAASLKDSSLFFSLRASPGGFVEFGGMYLANPSSGAFILELFPSAPFMGVLDSEGYPVFRAFEFETDARLRGESAYGVMGKASVNGSP